MEKSIYYLFKVTTRTDLLSKMLFIPKFLYYSIPSDRIFDRSGKNKYYYKTNIK